MNFLGGLKDRISTIYKGHSNDGVSNFGDLNNHLDHEDLVHTLNVIHDENKILKSKIRILENSVFGTSDGDVSSSKFGKIFQEVKSSFIFNNRNSFEDSKSGLSEFKNYLCDNLLFYNNIDEDDVDYLNNIQISEGDWEKNRELFIFKQKILEKNYSEMFKNIMASREISELANKLGKSMEKENSIDATTSGKELKVKKTKMNDIKTIVNGPIKEYATEELKNILLNEKMNIKEEDKSLIIDESEGRKIVTKSEKIRSPQLNDILIIDNEEEEFDISSVLIKEGKLDNQNKKDIKDKISNKNINSDVLSNTIINSNIKEDSSGPSQINSNPSGKTVNVRFSLENISTKKEEESTKNLLTSLLLNDESSNAKTSLQNSLKQTLSFSNKRTTSGDIINKINPTKTIKYAWDEEEDDL